MPFIQQGQLFGLTTAFLSPEGLLLSTCIHHTKEQWHSLSYLTDMASLLVKYKTSLNWQLLINTAKEKKD